MKRLSFLLVVSWSVGWSVIGANKPASQQTNKPITAEDRFSGDETWGCRKKHPAVVNSVCQIPSEDVISLRGDWQFLARRHDQRTRRNSHDHPFFPDVAPWGEDGETISADYLVLELKSDGSVAYSMSMGGETESKTGTWAQDGNTITITIDDEAMPFTLDGKTLSYTYGEGQYSSTTVLEKA